MADIEAKCGELDDAAVIEHFVSTGDLSLALGEPAGTEPTRMFVKGVMDYLDRDDRQNRYHLSPHDGHLVFTYGKICYETPYILAACFFRPNRPL